MKRRDGIAVLFSTFFFSFSAYPMPNSDPPIAESDEDLTGDPESAASGPETELKTITDPVPAAGDKGEDEEGANAAHLLYSVEYRDSDAPAMEKQNSASFFEQIEKELSSKGYLVRSIELQRDEDDPECTPKPFCVHSAMQSEDADYWIHVLLSPTSEGDDRVTMHTVMTLWDVQAKSIEGRVTIENETFDGFKAQLSSSFDVLFSPALAFVEGAENEETNEEAEAVESPAEEEETPETEDLVMVDDWNADAPTGGDDAQLGFSNEPEARRLEHAPRSSKQVAKEEKEKSDAINWGEHIWRWGWIGLGGTISVSGAGFDLISPTSVDEQLTWLDAVGPGLVLAGMAIACVGVVVNPLAEGSDD